MYSWILNSVWLLLVCFITTAYSLISLPDFAKMKENYPGYGHFGGLYHNNKIINMIGCKRDLLLHDTSALRLSYAFNKVGGEHSLGKSVVHLSRTGVDSVTGHNGLQYLYHPIAYGPFLADKYGYPSITKLHQQDPVSTKKTFWGKQGILQVITYRKIKNLPVGHVALWDCDHFHQTKDWISGHSLITVEFWESPDSNCSRLWTKSPVSSLDTKQKQDISLNHQHHKQSMDQLPKQPIQQEALDHGPSLYHHLKQGNPVVSQKSQDLKTLLKDKTFRKQFIKKYYVSNGHLRHAKHRGLIT